MIHPSYYNLHDPRRKRSQTLQPVRRNDHTDFNHQLNICDLKASLGMTKSTTRTNNYENVVNHEVANPMINQHRVTQHPQMGTCCLPDGPSIQNTLANSRHKSHSHEYNYQHYHQIYDPESYYNISRCHDLSQLTNDTPQPLDVSGPPAVESNQVRRLDKITVMQICNEIYHLDSSPPIPEPRMYTVDRIGPNVYLKNRYPQIRCPNRRYTDPITNMSISPGIPLKVIGPCNEDRSKLIVAFEDCHVRVPCDLFAQSIGE